ncbi:prefoldin subunit 3 isoform X1 [Calypte anna]|uniref:prefoldin subunit 3 isoform X1 n=1 Tax=Calypte anna TaxID=9244 RepID=UPI0011C3E4ED|nr:prefoldin subunit 3 isoform X1 [Calypte anna]
MAAATSSETGSGGVAAGEKRGPLGIPEAVFVEDVDSFMKQPGNETADVVLKKLDEQYQKYKFLELNLAQKKRRLKSQIPEIKQTLEILKHMQKKKDSTHPMETRFLLADNLYCKASVPPTDKVCLWLGANVMLEYDIDEAQALLEKNLSTATRNLDLLEEELDFLRDQFTTTEVSILSVSLQGQRCVSAEHSSVVPQAPAHPSAATGIFSQQHKPGAGVGTA